MTQIWRLILKPLTIGAKSLVFHFDDQDIAIAAMHFINEKFPNDFETNVSSINIWKLDFDKIEQRIDEFFEFLFPDNEDIGE